MSSSPFDHPLLSGLLGDPQVAACFTVEAELREMLRFERSLALVEAEAGIIAGDAARRIAAQIDTFAPSLPDIAAATARDGVVVVELVRQLRQHVGEPHARYVHFGATSQDVVDTALVLRLRTVVEILAGRLSTLDGQLVELDLSYGANRLMGRTRMQDAVPITVHDRLATWRAPLQAHLTRLEQLSPRLLRVQLGGAAGTLEKLGGAGPALVARLAEDLGLSPSRSWHSERDGIVEFAGWLALVSGTLGKIGIDVALMAQNAVGEVALTTGGSSSTMAHKRNPVGAEVLVALARYSAALSAGTNTALVHEQERSGAAWMLEWLALPQMVMATAAGLRTTGLLLENISRLGAQP